LNRASALIGLKRLAEAKAELDACLEIFKSDPARRATVLSALAFLYFVWSDIPQAIVQERRALALLDALPDPSGRASSHNNLARYLDRSGAPAPAAEAAHHRLAALSYRLVAGLGEQLKTSRHNYVVLFRRARAAGVPPAIPRLAELIADPAFHALQQWLQDRSVDLDALQATIDQVLAAVREAAEREETPPS